MFTGLIVLQKRDAVVAIGLNLLVPASNLEVGSWVTPRVVVARKDVSNHSMIKSRLNSRHLQSKEVGTCVLVTTVHIRGSLEAMVANIGSRIANGNDAEITFANITLDVANDGLDVGSSACQLGFIQHFIGSKEEQSVVVLSKELDGGKDVA